MFQEKSGNGEENETDVNKHKAEPSRIPVEALDDIEDSDSEPEGMCGTLAMFPGIGVFPRERGRGQLTVYYTCTRSYIKTFSYSLAQQLWGVYSILIGWFI